jgi:hypothetical protein
MMKTNTATKFENQPDDRQQLESALNNWREHILRWLRNEIAEDNEEREAAEDGLALAHRHKGQVADDVINTLWDKLERTSDLLFRLARISDQIQEMDFPDLLTLFAHTTKQKTYPWEGDAWQLPSSMF